MLVKAKTDKNSMYSVIFGGSARLFHQHPAAHKLGAAASFVAGVPHCRHKIVAYS